MVELHLPDRIVRIVRSTEYSVQVFIHTVGPSQDERQVDPSISLMLTKSLPHTHPSGFPLQILLFHARESTRSPCSFVRPSHLVAFSVRSRKYECDNGVTLSS